MQVAEQIRADVTAAMKAGDRNRVTALRLVLSELQKDAKEGGGRRAGRAAARAQAPARVRAGLPRGGPRGSGDAARRYEAETIEAYLPAALSDEEIDALVARAIEDTGASSPRDMGRVIKQVMAAAGGRADGRTVSTKVKEALS